MNQHLSSEQVSRWIAGERLPEQETHLRNCPQCAAEIERIGATLKLFGGAIRRLSTQESARIPQSVAQMMPVRSFWPLPLRWGAALAALLIAVGIPFYRNAMNERHQREIAKADAALLEQIDAEVSRAVPAPMEPLVNLVAWDSSNTRGGDNTR